MAWTIEYSATAVKYLRKLDRQTALRIDRFLHERIAGDGNPRETGKAMVGGFSGHWRYRVGDHRLICKLEDQRMTILVIKIGDRKDVYR